MMNKKNNLLRLLKKIWSQLISIYQNLLELLKFSSLQWLYLVTKLNLSGKPVIIKDWVGNRYWQYSSRDNIRLNCNRNSVTDGNHIIKYILENVKEDWVCIDIGAHIGAISIPLWSVVASKGKVFSIEPDPINLKRLIANLELNNYPTRHVLNAAIADKRGLMRLRCYPKSPGWQTLGNPTFAISHNSYMMRVPTVRFNDLLVFCDSDRVDFIKIDVEGAELLVLNGMRPWLEDKQISCIIFEVNHLMLEGMGYTVVDLRVFWEEFDYKLWRLVEDGSLTPILNYWSSKSVWDCVALPCV